MTETSEYRPFPNDRGRNWRQARLEVPALVRSIRLPDAPRVLEVGCGQGVALGALARLRRPRHLVGIDIDPGVVAEARRALDADRIGAEVRVADVRALPFEDAAFDVVIESCGRLASRKAERCGQRAVVAAGDRLDAGRGHAAQAIGVKHVARLERAD